MKGFPKCLCIAATSMVQPVLTAAWQGTLTVPGMGIHAQGSTQLGSGEYQTFSRKSKLMSPDNRTVVHIVRKNSIAVFF